MADCAGFENRCTLGYRGFESRPLRFFEALYRAGRDVSNKMHTNPRERGGLCLLGESPIATALHTSVDRDKSPRMMDSPPVFPVMIPTGFSLFDLTLGQAHGI